MEGILNLLVVDLKPFNGKSILKFAHDGDESMIESPHLESIVRIFLSNEVACGINYGK